MKFSQEEASLCLLEEKKNFVFLKTHIKSPDFR